MTTTPTPFAAVVGLAGLERDRCDDKRMKADWETYGPSLLTWWQTKHPKGTMPYAWWEFEAKNSRDLLHCRYVRGRLPDGETLESIAEAEREFLGRMTVKALA